MWRFVLALSPSLVGCGSNDKDKDDAVDTDEPVDTAEPLVEDVFVQDLLSPIDILWVVDPGWEKGMDDLEEEALEGAWETLLLADPSWRIGVIDATIEPGTPSFGLR